jgi:predicted small secreted protein
MMDRVAPMSHARLMPGPECNLAPARRLLRLNLCHRNERPIMSHARRLLFALAAILFTTSTLTACGDTWRGAKEDTGDNLKATGRTLENAGEKVQP